MNRTELLHQLIDLVAGYEASLPSGKELRLEDFFAYADGVQAPQGSPSVFREDMVEARIARQISLLHRVSRLSIRQALQHSDYLQSEEDYTYLVCLLREKALSKSELHKRNCMEKTSGAVIISRLLRYRLVEEAPDPDDKRSILVSITDLGRGELRKVFPHLGQAAAMLSASLSDRQRASLASLLDQMMPANLEFYRKGQHPTPPAHPSHPSSEPRG